jgi:hypothetical protein
MHVDSPNHCTDRRFTEKYRKDSKHDSLSVSNYSKKTLSLSLPPSLPPMHGEEGPHYQGVGVPSEIFLFLEILEESVKVCTDYSKDPRLLYSK